MRKRPPLQYSLQALRVPSGWTITLNNLFDVELTPDTAHWFSSSVLLGGCRRSTGYCFDSRVEPEGDPEGEFVVEFLTLRYDKHQQPIQHSEVLLEEFRTRSKAEYIARIERYMLEH
jgi:hypothetical protein